jgi:hypothetical protein
MNSIRKYVLLFIAVTAGLVILNSCRKSDSDKKDPASKQAKADAVKAIQKKYGNISTPTVYPVYKSADGFYVNANGEEIPIKKRLSGIQSTLSCNMDCNTASDPSDLDLVYTLSHVLRFFYCGSTTGSQITATWNISVPYTVLDAHPTNSTLKSKGRMRFKNSQGQILTSNTNLQPISITANGADPNCGSNFLYTVTYTWSGVADSYFSNGNTLECSLFAYNDCDLTGNNYLTSWVLAAVYPGSGTYALPCSRIDKVWVNNSTGSNSGQCATAGGAYLTCPSYPSGFTPTASQQVEYRKRDNASSFNWTDQTSTVYNGEVAPGTTVSPTVSACCGVLSLRNMYQGQSTTGWLVRYRNVYTGCAVITPINSTWTNGTYVTEYWLY